MKMSTKPVPRGVARTISYSCAYVVVYKAVQSGLFSLDAALKRKILIEVFDTRTTTSIKIRYLYQCITHLLIGIHSYPMQFIINVIINFLFNPRPVSFCMAIKTGHFRILLTLACIARLIMQTMREKRRDLD